MSLTRTILALLAALMLALTACTGGDGEPSPDGTDGDGAEVRNPDTIVHAADDEPLSLDPAQAEPGEGGESVILQVYERLVEFSPEGPELQPGLATEVPSSDNGMISEDGLTYSFPIRTDVTFHDGSALTADDVKFSWDRVLEMGLPESNAGLLADTVAETEVVDEQTFEVTLNQPNAAFLNSVVTQSVASVVSQEVVDANGCVTFGSTPVSVMRSAIACASSRSFAPEWCRNVSREIDGRSAISSPNEWAPPIAHTALTRGSKAAVRGA